MSEPSGNPGKLPATSDIVQRARAALDAWPGEPITDDDRKVNAVIGSITVAQYELVRDLLALVAELESLVDAMSPKHIPNSDGHGDDDWEW